MNCHLHANTIGDLARDVVIHTDVAAAARAHLDECPACAAMFARQRELTAGLRVLAASVAAARPSPALQQRLLDVFTSQQMDPRIPRTAGSARTPRIPRLAAAVICAAAALGWLWSGAPKPRPQEQRVSSVAAQAPTHPTRSAVAAPSPAPVQARPRPTRHRRSKAAPAIEDFVPVPGSAAMPAFESGQIIRVELPVGALPTYGVEIAPDAVHSRVAADLLVGQDGHTRAIRLVQRR